MKQITIEPKEDITAFELYRILCLKESAKRRTALRIDFDLEKEYDSQDPSVKRHLNLAEDGAKKVGFWGRLFG